MIFLRFCLTVMWCTTVLPASMCYKVDQKVCKQYQYADMLLLYDFRYYIELSTSLIQLE